MITHNVYLKRAFSLGDFSCLKVDMCVFVKNRNPLENRGGLFYVIGDFEAGV